MEKTFDDMLTDQSEIRKRMVETMKKEKLSIAPMAKKLGISHQTLRRFVVNEANLRWSQICKIYEYCAKTNS